MKYIFLTLSLLFETQNSMCSTFYPLEIEAKRSKITLHEIKKNLTIFEEISLKQTSNFKDFLSQKALKKAAENFSKGQYHLAISSTNTFLSLTKSQSNLNFSSIYYIRSISLKNLGFEEQGFSAYKKYVSSFLASEKKNYEEFIAIFNTFKEYIFKNKKTEESMISVLGSIDIPKDYTPILYIELAKYALDSRSFKLALNWINIAEKFSFTPQLKASTTYLRGLYYLRTDKIDLAKKAFYTTIDQNVGYVDDSHYAIARIFYLNENYERALHHYLKIKKDSTIYNQANLESVYTLYHLNKFGEAYAKASIFMSKNKSNKNISLRNFMPYLNILAGNLDSAKISIKNEINQDRLFQEFLSKVSLKKNTFGKKSLRNLINMSKKRTGSNILAENFQNTFEKIDEKKIELTSIKNQIREKIHALGRTSGYRFHPIWKSQIALLKYWSLQVLAVSHRMVQSEMYHQKSKLSNQQNMQLHASLSRRIKTLKKFENQRNIAEPQYMKSLEVDNHVFKTVSTIRRNLGKLYSSNYFLEKNNYFSQKTQAQELISKFQFYEKNALEILDSSRIHRFNLLSALSPHHKLSAIIVNYKKEINKSNVTLNQHRLANSKSSQRFLFEDILHLWNMWEESIQTTLKLSSKLDTSIKKHIHKTLTTIKSQLKQHKHAEIELLRIEDDIKNQLIGSLPIILNQIDHARNLRQARIHKWLADIQWLAYQNKKSEFKKTLEDYKLKNQKIHEELSDLQYGAVFPWLEHSSSSL